MPYRAISLLEFILIFVVFQFLNGILSFTDFFCKCKCDDGATKSSILTALAMLLIFAGAAIANNIYKDNNIVRVEDHMQEQISDIPEVDTSIILQTRSLIQGYNLSSPVYRNGSWIYIPYTGGNVESPGYFFVKGKDIKYVTKKIKYSQYMSYKYNPMYAARQVFPTKIFFGDPSLQINAKNDKMYYAFFYGEYQFLYSGRNIEGIILVDVEDGKVTVQKDVPEFVEGIAE